MWLVQGLLCSLGYQCLFNMLRFTWTLVHSHRLDVLRFSCIIRNNHICNVHSKSNLCTEKKKKNKSQHPSIHHHYHPSLAWPRSGQAGSWETIPVALLTFFISERLKNIPDTAICDLLLLFAVNTPWHTRAFLTPESPRGHATLIIMDGISSFTPLL